MEINRCGPAIERVSSYSLVVICSKTMTIIYADQNYDKRGKQYLYDDDQVFDEAMVYEDNFEDDQIYEDDQAYNSDEANDNNETNDIHEANESDQTSRQATPPQELQHQVPENFAEEHAIAESGAEAGRASLPSATECNDNNKVCAICFEPYSIDNSGDKRKCRIDDETRCTEHLECMMSNNACDHEFCSQCVEKLKDSVGPRRRLNCPLCRRSKGCLAPRIQQRFFHCDSPGCNFVTANRHEREIHRHTHEYFQCHIRGCNFITTERHLLESHRQNHMVLGPFQCNHPGCFYITPRRYNLRRHMLRHERDQRNHPQNSDG